MPVVLLKRYRALFLLAKRPRPVLSSVAFGYIKLNEPFEAGNPTDGGPWPTWVELTTGGFVNIITAAGVVRAVEI